MIIRPAAASDLDRLREIQSASPEASSWNPLDYDCLVCESHQGIAGFLVSRETIPGEPRETIPGEREILNVAVDPAQRRSGVAKRLLASELARSQGQWFLEVRESNTPAIGLYRSLGFVPAGRRPKYYHAPSEAAIVMRFFS